jgi:poly(3-hydroxybutyrate) depolymerase
LSYYDFGATTVYAAAADPSCAWCAYIPQSYEEHGDQLYPLAVIVHGTERGMQAYRDAFTDFAEARQTIVLCPLFPANLCFPGDLSSYKILRHEGRHYDRILLGMIDEARAKWRLHGDRVLMYGFSGGGHFTHRFLYLYPDRLLAAAVGAPGIVTLLDDRHDFWVGTRDMAARFGRPIDRAAIARVPVLLVAGGADVETWEIAIPPGSTWWMPGADLAGTNRIERIEALTRSLQAAGVAAELQLVPGVAHDDRRLIPLVKDFFAEVLDRTFGLQHPSRPQPGDAPT